MDENQFEVRIQAVEANVQEMADALSAVHQTCQLLLLQQNSENEENLQPVRSKDVVWACTSCGAKLGMYSKEKDELRLRYKELAIYMVPGVGGSISVPCRRCAELNTLEDTRAIAQVTQGTRPKVD